uniref:Uncharacterized protein n=1 Tax=Lepeophtheirus salmonis TaxID=72036 RepID=A0A0K2T1I5_LEPSM
MTDTASLPLDMNAKIVIEGVGIRALGTQKVAKKEFRRVLQ